jgi:hypothetical protein
MIKSLSKFTLTATQEKKYAKDMIQYHEGNVDTDNDYSMMDIDYQEGTWIRPADARGPQEPIDPSLLQTLVEYKKTRMDIYRIMKKRFINMESCLEYNKDGNMVLSSKAAGQDIIFNKRIGSPSVDGEVYNVYTHISKKHVHRFVTKITKVTDGNTLEIKTLQRTSQVVNDEGIINFPSMYASLKCKENIMLCLPYCPDLLKYKEPYYTVYSDLANAGDLQTFLTRDKELSLNECVSILRQIVYTIYMFHTKIHANHTDLHLGNFLVNQVKAGGGDFTYTLDGQKIKVPNYGYVIIIWDFGRVVPVGRHCYTMDYIRTLSLLASIGISKTYIKMGLRPLPYRVVKKIHEIGMIVHDPTMPEEKYVKQVDKIILSILDK